MRARLPSSSAHAFFSPSYRVLQRSHLFSAPTSTTTTSAKGKGRSISFSSSGASSRSGSNSGPIKPPSSSSASTRTTAAKAPSSPKQLSKAVPHAPPLPHNKPNLVVGLDSFFALHRPLLELPLTLGSRKSVRTATAMMAPLNAEAQESEELELPFSPDEVREAVSAHAGDEVVQVVDLDADGKAVGAPYLTTIAPTNLGSSGSEVVSEEVVEEEEISSWEDVENEEVFFDAYEEGYKQDPDATNAPYNDWLIGESEWTANEVPLRAARYIAARQPFTAPPPPSPSTGAAPSARSYLSPQTVADMSFLRPFQLPVAPRLTITPQSKQDRDFVDAITNRLHSDEAASVALQFLSSQSSPLEPFLIEQTFAPAMNKMEKALAGYRTVHTFSTESLEPLSAERKASLKSWVEIHLKKKPVVKTEEVFAPAELFSEAEWDSEVMARVANGELVELGKLRAHLDGVAMDSVKRKRKKKITKHKYKKRRKAQKALRQRLGK